MCKGYGNRKPYARQDLDPRKIKRIIKFVLKMAEEKRVPMLIE